MVEYELLGLKVWIPDFNDLNQWIVKPITDFLTSAWNSGGALFNAIVQGVKDGLNWFFSAAGNFLKQVQDTVTTAFQTFLKDTGAFFDSIGKTVYDALIKSAGTVWTQILGVGTDILAALTKFFADSGQGIATALGGLSAFVGDTWNAVLKSVGELEFTILNGFKYWVGEAAEYIINSLGQVGNGIGQVLNVAKGWFDQLSADIQANTGNILETISYIIPATRLIMLAQNETVQKTITDGLGSIWAGIQEGLLKPLQEAGSSIYNALAMELNAIFTGGSGLLSGIVDTFRGIWDSIVAFLNSFIAPDKKEIFANPIGWITKILGSVITTYGSFAIAMNAGEILQPLKNMGFVNFAAYLKDLGDFQRVIGNIFSTLQEKATIQPLNQALNLLFRPRYMDIKTADTWMFKGIIDGDGWKQIYAQNGWNDELIEKYYGDVWTEPSDRLLIAFADTPGVPDGWIDKKIAARGYDEVDRVLFKTYITNSRLKDEFTQLKSAYEAAYIKGYVGYEQYAAILKAIGRNELEIAWALESATRKADTARLTEDIDIIIQAFRAGKLDLAGLTANISGLPLVPDRAQNLIDKEIARKKTLAVTERAIRQAKLSLSDILKAYDLGLMSELDAITRIMQLDYTTDDANLIMQVHKADIAAKEANAEAKAELAAARAAAREDMRLATAYASFLIKSIKARQISLDNAIAEISLLPLSAERKELLYQNATLANSTLKTEEVPDAPETLRETEVYRALRLGLIDLTQAAAYLKALGFDDELIALKLAINQPLV